MAWLSTPTWVNESKTRRTEYETVGSTFTVEGVGKLFHIFIITEVAETVERADGLTEAAALALANTSSHTESEHAVVPIFDSSGKVVPYEYVPRTETTDMSAQRRSDAGDWSVTRTTTVRVSTADTDLSPKPVFPA